MKIKVFYVEDEPFLGRIVKESLETRGFDVRLVTDGGLVQNVFEEIQPDICVLDVMLPKLSGFDVCKAARAAGIRTPILLLTAKGEEIDKVLGLELGADDYLTKPFSVRELLARIKAILRRSQSDTSSHQHAIISIGRLAVERKTLLQASQR